MRQLHAYAPDGVGEVVAGTDLVDLVVGALSEHGLHDGDVAVLTSKIVSKAEGRIRRGEREDLLAEQTIRVVARRGRTTIVENHLGLVMAAAGIDASNVARGDLLLLPADPDATAQRIREGIAALAGRNIAVVISDTSGRPWRTGQTDIAIGCAGIEPVDNHAGRRDAHGNDLVVTAPAVADEIAALAELVTTKLGGRPVTLVRGLAHHVLPAGEHGPGAHTLIRAAADDMFSLGTREAVEAALCGRSSDFGSPATAEEFAGALQRCGWAAHHDEDGVHLLSEDRGPEATVLATAYGWALVDGTSTFRPVP